MITLLSFLATSLVLSAVYYISKPRLRGQYLILGADACWFVFAVATGNIALGIQSVVLFSIGVSAVRNWSKKQIPF